MKANCLIWLIALSYQFLIKSNLPPHVSNFSGENAEDIQKQNGTRHEHLHNGFQAPSVFPSHQKKSDKRLMLSLNMCSFNIPPHHHSCYIIWKPMHLRDVPISWKVIFSRVEHIFIAKEIKSASFWIFVNCKIFDFSTQSSVWKTHTSETKQRIIPTCESSESMTWAS